MPSRSAPPGRTPSMSASAPSTSRSVSSTASGFLRSIPTDRRLRFATLPGMVSIPLGPVGRSSRMTSAPRSASIMQANGPGPIPAISTMRIPLSGPMGREGTVRLGRRSDSVAPDLVGDLDDETELGHFLVVGQVVALLRRGEPALRRQAELVERDVAGGFVDAALEIVLPL